MPVWAQTGTPVPPTTTATPTATETPLVGEVLVCPGDCNGDFRVEIAELVRGVGIALGTIGADECPVFEGAPISELVTAVRSATEGCEQTARLAPPPTAPVIECQSCCADCVDTDCVRACVGRDRCVLVAEWSGVVRDARSGDPIEGATVTLNDTTVSSGPDGSYSVRAETPETCTGLDYLYTFSVQAAGFTTVFEQLYRVPFPVEQGRSIDLVPTEAAPALIAGADWLVAPMREGRLF